MLRCRLEQAAFDMQAGSLVSMRRLGQSARSREAVLAMLRSDGPVPEGLFEALGRDDDA